MNNKVILVISCLLLTFGCRKKEEPTEPKLEYTETKTETEEQNLKSLCKASSEVAKMEGVQDRMSRIAEIAAPVSTTTDLVDGLSALEGPERLPLLKKLIEKYDTEKDCKDLLLMFEKSIPKPPDEPPQTEGQGPGKGQRPPQGMENGKGKGDPSEKGPPGEPGKQGQPGPEDKKGPPQGDGPQNRPNK